MKTKDFQEKYEYSLTKPSKGAKKGQLLLVPDENRDRIISLTSLEIKNGEQDGITCGPNLPNAYYKSVDWEHLILPVAKPYSLFNDSKQKYLLMKAKSQIHPDDIPYLQKPFLIDEYMSDYYKLAIPYKSKNGILYFYVTKELEPVSKRRTSFHPNMNNIVVKAIVLPPAFVVDVATLPIQIVVFVYEFSQWRGPYP